MTTHTATGSFEVQLTPQGDINGSEADAQMGRMALEKQFQGDLEGTGKGEMLTGMTATRGSAGYVAVERVTGRLHGRSGSFTFLHRGVMSQAGQELTITVVPDSGSGELAGITGSFTIDIRDGNHFYVFEYSLPTAGESE